MITRLKKHITGYYKNIFGPPEKNNFQLVETHKDDIPQVAEEENDLLTDQFTEEEVKRAVFQMENNKAPGPGGFPMEFYHVLWELIKEDLMALFHDFREGTLPLFSLNFRTIILLPKCKEAITI